MGWAKYMEDDLEMIESRNSGRYYEVYSISYPSPVPKPAKKNTPIDRSLLDFISPFEDKQILCRDCGRIFSFTAEKQKQFSERGWNPPKRCKKCKSERNIRFLMQAAY